jgi:phage shock protein A
MFEDWKKAWEQAVSNFQRELEEEDQPGDVPGHRAASMRRDLANAKRALERLQGDIVSSRQELSREEEEIATCERRAAQAERIGDAETARIATEFARKHTDRAAILRRKVEVLQDEFAMRKDELTVMEQQAETEFAEIRQAQTDRIKHEAEFRQLDQQRRERDAEARLEELKKRMK